MHTSNHPPGERTHNKIMKIMGCTQAGARGGHGDQRYSTAIDGRITTHGAGTCLRC